METPSPPAPRAAPDWSNQTEEIHCPLCDYNLRGLVEPRCPECGYRFEWVKLIDPAQRLHPYLFEHHPERRLRSFVNTMTGSLRPRRFWSLLHPRQASHPRRLVGYWVLNLLLVLVPSTVMAAPYIYNYYRWKSSDRQRLEAQVARFPSAVNLRIVERYGSVANYMDAVAPRPFGLISWRQIISRAAKHVPLLAAGITYLAWPWCGALLLMMYQQSMRRARIQPAHILRCLVYSADGTLLFLAGVLPMAMVFVIYFIHLNNIPPVTVVYRWLRTVGMIAVPLVWLAATWRMIVAYRRYLQFPHAAAVVLATELILFLGLLCILLLLMRPTDAIRMLRIW